MSRAPSTPCRLPRGRCGTGTAHVAWPVRMPTRSCSQRSKVTSHLAPSCCPPAACPPSSLTAHLNPPYTQYHCPSRLPPQPASLGWGACAVHPPALLSATPNRLSARHHELCRSGSGATAAGSRHPIRGRCLPAPGLADVWPAACSPADGSRAASGSSTAGDVAFQRTRRRRWWAASVPARAG